MRVRPTHQPRLLTPTVSVANIVLLLVLFFGTTAVRELDRARVSLPRAVNLEAAAEDSATVVIYRSRQGVLSYSYTDGKGTAVDFEGPREVYYEATARIAQDPRAQFILKADGDIPFEKIDELLDQLRDAGVQRVLLVARPGIERSR